MKKTLPKIRISWMLLTLFISIIFLVSCGSGVTVPSKALIGKWSGGPCTAQYFTLYGDPLKQIEFTSGGTYIWNNALGGPYSLIDNQRVGLTYSGASVVYTFSISGDTLTLTNSSGDNCVLNRTS